MSVHVKLIGIEQVMKAARELEDNLKKKVIATAARKASVPLIASAKSKVSVSNRPHHRYSEGKIVATYYPGNLKKSIAFFKSKKSTPNDLIFMVAPRTGGGRKNDGWYGRFLEYGTKNMAAQPFMGPAFESTKSTMDSIMSNEILTAVDKFNR